MSVTVFALDALKDKAKRGVVMQSQILVEVSVQQVDQWEALLTALGGLDFEGPSTFRTSLPVIVSVALRRANDRSGTRLAVKVDDIDGALAGAEEFETGSVHHFGGGVSQTLHDESGASLLIYQLHAEGEQHV